MLFSLPSCTGFDTLTVVILYRVTGWPEQLGSRFSNNIQNQTSVILTTCFFIPFHNLHWTGTSFCRLTLCVCLERHLGWSRLYRVAPLTYVLRLINETIKDEHQLSTATYYKNTIYCVDTAADTVGLMLRTYVRRSVRRCASIKRTNSLLQFITPRCTKKVATLFSVIAEVTDDAMFCEKMLRKGQRRKRSGGECSQHISVEYEWPPLR